MTYQVLARKWRPQTFAALVGQQHVLQALVNALDLQRLHHAYLFTGTRGVGKTTIARLIAKALNCEQGVSSQPCNQCQTCVDITAGRFVDLFEVDAASRTKVEDTRDMLENVQYAPTRGRYKIYLIDEVHMLSGHSFNALLKTLEEPPQHVKFLLATTDPQKLPITVLSRCLQFHLKNLSPTQISEHLVDVLQKENIASENPALQLLAAAANGSMRDALSLLDQAIAVGGGQVSQSAVEVMLGVTGNQALADLLEALTQQDLTALLAISERLQSLGVDYAYILSKLQEILHQAALCQFEVRLPESTTVSEAQLTSFAKTFSKEDVQLFYEIVALGRRDLALAPSPKIGFEMVLLRLLAFRPGLASPQEAKPIVATNNVSTPIPKAPVRAAEPPKAFSSEKPSALSPSRTTSTYAGKAAAFSQSSAPTTATKPSNDIPPWGEPTNTAPAAVPSESNLISASVAQSGQGPAQASRTAMVDTSDPWASLLPQLGLTAFSKALAEHLSFERRVENHFYLSLAEVHAPMLQERHRQKIVEALNQYFGQPMQVTIQVGRSVQTKSPLEIREQHQQQKVQQALTGFAQDPQLQKVLQTYDGRVLPETLSFEET